MAYSREPPSMSSMDVDHQFGRWELELDRGKSWPTLQASGLQRLIFDAEYQTLNSVIIIIIKILLWACGTWPFYFTDFLSLRLVKAIGAWISVRSSYHNGDPLWPESECKFWWLQAQCFCCKAIPLSRYIMCYKLSNRSFPLSCVMYSSVLHQCLFSWQWLISEEYGAASNQVTTLIGVAEFGYVQNDFHPW